jgi:hypothetical protein
MKGAVRENSEAAILVETAGTARARNEPEDTRIFLAKPNSDG